MTNGIFAAFAAVAGAIIGSFLNACIHRMPRGISLDNPRRSFCPSCNRMIPWYENLPVISWIALRGKCSGCGAPISPRYILVEILTALCFASAWQLYRWPLAPIYWIFLALLIVATFIDIEHFIIPDEITWGGTAAGLILSVICPLMMDADSRWHSFLQSLGGAALGFGLLWLIVEFGKLAFGKKRHRFDPAEPFQLVHSENEIKLELGEEYLPWEDIFSRTSDELVLECERATVNGQESAPATLRFRHDRLIQDGQSRPLEELESVSGIMTAITIPREAMGFGDVKFIAAIGAFLGWKAVLFTLFASSIIGCVAGVAGLFLARDKSGARIPFGPFLALGAAWWIFGGQNLFDCYFGAFRGPIPLNLNF